MNFNDLWELRVPRKPNNPRNSAEKAYNARIRAGYTFEDMKAGLERYRAYCEAEGIIKTKFVMMLSTFLGPDLHFLEDWECEKKLPEWAILPRLNDDLWPHAKKYGLSNPGTLTYALYRKKLQDEIEARLNESK